MRKLLDGIKEKRTVVLIISSAIWMLLAHGMMLFNKYSFHDDSVFFNGIGATLSSGRWMLFLMGKAVSFFHQTNLASLPLVNGIITMIWLVAIMYIIFQQLDIKSHILIILLSGLVISFPAITGIMIFMFTAPYYYFGAFLGVIGIYYFYDRKTVISGIICSVLMTCSIGTYQANLSICMCTMLLFMLNDIYREDYNWGSYFQLGLKNIGICVIAVAEYLLINKIFLIAFNSSMSSYLGANSFGVTSLLGYVRRIILAYYRFLIPHEYHCANMYPNSSKYFYLLFLIASILLIIFWVVYLKKKGKKVNQILILLAVFPLAAHFIYVMQDVDKIHCRMAFSEVMLYMLVAWIIERMKDNSDKYRSFLIKIILSTMGIITYLDVYYANACYTKAEILQSQTVSYFNTLITRIKMTDGYTDETPVVYINNFPREDDSFVGANYLFEGINLYPYTENTLLSDYAWKETMKLWCGFDPKGGDIKEFEDNEQVKTMPCYPDDGSIANVEGTIVVKFAEEPKENVEKQ